MQTVMLYPNAGNTIQMAWLKSGNKMKARFLSCKPKQCFCCIFPKKRVCQWRSLRKQSWGKCREGTTAGKLKSCRRTNVGVFTRSFGSFHTKQGLNKRRSVQPLENVDCQGQEVKINILLSILLSNSFIYGVWHFYKCNQTLQVLSRLFGGLCLFINLYFPKLWGEEHFSFLYFIKKIEFVEWFSLTCDNAICFFVVVFYMYFSHETGSHICLLWRSPQNHMYSEFSPKLKSRVVSHFSCLSMNSNIATI